MLYHKPSYMSVDPCCCGLHYTDFGIHRAVSLVKRQRAWSSSLKGALWCMFNLGQMVDISLPSVILNLLRQRDDVCGDMVFSYIFGICFFHGKQRGNHRYGIGAGLNCWSTLIPAGDRLPHVQCVHMCSCHRLAASPAAKCCEA